VDNIVKFIRALAVEALADKGISDDVVIIVHGVASSIEQGDIGIEDAAEVVYRQLVKCTGYVKESR